MCVLGGGGGGLLLILVAMYIQMYVSYMIYKVVINKYLILYRIVNPIIVAFTCRSVLTSLFLNNVCIK